jgi:hypothetical protein
MFRDCWAIIETLIYCDTFQEVITNFSLFYTQTVKISQVTLPIIKMYDELICEFVKYIIYLILLYQLQAMLC